MRFRATVIPFGNATAVAVPDDIMQALGPEGRPLVAITINGHHWRSRVAAMRGRRLIGISAAHRDAARIREGDDVDVDVERDTAPRVVAESDDLATALDARAAARHAFDALPFGLRQKHVNAIQDAKTAEIRVRRIGKLVTSLQAIPAAAA